MPGPLQTYGPSLIDAGFPIVAIHEGRKNPVGRDWQNNPLTKGDLPRYNGAGVGLLAGTGQHPVAIVDIDCAWGPGIREAERLAFVHLGFAPQRIGEPPKQALIYRAAEGGWPKRVSASFQHASCPTRMSRNAVGEELREKPQILRIEMLGKGQQAVIYGTHPVTERPFTWIDAFGGIAYMVADDLVTVTEEQVTAFIEAWEAWMRAQEGVTLYLPQTETRQVQSYTHIEPLPQPKTGAPIERFREILALRDPWPRAEWIKVGLSLHHEFDGDPDAFDLWVDWSRRWPEWDEDRNFAECEYQWGTFRHNKENIATAGSLVREWRKTTGRTPEEDDLNAFREKIRSAPSIVTLPNFIAESRHLVDCSNPAIVGLAVAAVQEKAKSFGESISMTKSEVTKLLKGREDRKSKKSESFLADDAEFFQQDFINWDFDKTPAPIRGWTWSAKGDLFINVDTGVEHKKEGFNGLFSRAAQSSGYDSAAAWVHTLLNIPHADQTIYWPGAGKLLIRNGIRYINTWSDREYTKVPEDLSDPIHALGAGLMQKHIAMVCGGWNREAHLLANFLKLCITKPGTKVRWAPLIVGDPGDGKTFFSDFMRFAVGNLNVRTIDNTAMKAAAESGFNSFAGCAQVACLNEVKMHGHNRYDIFNALKPLVTDSTISITKKGFDQENVLNFTNWMLFSNYRDCMPIDSTDRRYFVIWSAFPIKKIRAEDPTYFSKIYECMNLGGVGGMIRWLNEVEWHEDFKINDPAPITNARARMIRMSADDLVETIKVVITSSKSWAVQPDLLLYGYLKDLLLADGYQANDFELNRALAQIGWLKIGVVYTDSLIKGTVWSTMDLHKSEAERTFLNRYNAQLSVASLEF